ncbi:MAG TPA: hypothetical protein V6D47_20810 [Oscillatoriaceae cyanobacterium]
MIVTFDDVARSVTIDPENGTAPFELTAESFAVICYFDDVSAGAVVRGHGIDLSIYPPPAAGSLDLSESEPGRWRLSVEQPTE